VSSSPRWVVILAAVDVVIDSHPATPIFLNLILMFGILYAVDNVIKSFARRKQCPASGA